MAQSSEVAARRDTFDAFFASAWTNVLGYATALTRDALLAQEVAQEAFTRSYARWGLVRDPLAYTLRVTRNLAADQGRRREVPVPDLPDAATPPVADDRAWDAVLALSPALRDAVVLHYYCDLPVAEVARVLRRPVGTVKRRLHDAREALADALGGTDD